MPHTPRLVVGIAASAGDLEALEQLLQALPEECNMAFVLVQHLEPGQDSMLSALLASPMDMQVVEAQDSGRIEPNTVHVIPPNIVFAVNQGGLEQHGPAAPGDAVTAVDSLFHSLARAYGPRAAAIVLSGKTRDGTASLRATKAAGGLTMVQQPGPVMAESALRGVLDCALDIAEMPSMLERFARLAITLDDEHRDAVEQSALEKGLDHELSGRDIDAIASIIELYNDFNIRAYKPATIGRRVRRRMNLANVDSFDTYLDTLRGSKAEQKALFHDFFIGVTDFFRDPEAFEELASSVIAPLIMTAQPEQIIRAWIPACATGEEAYSVAMLLLEAMDAYQKQLHIQVFATDVDQAALDVARAGVYPQTIVRHLSQQRLDSFFCPLAGGAFQVRPRLRELVSFATHDLCRDPPFARMDLISCRNVLIYLRSTAQEQVLDALHFALKPEGCLFLGLSETVGTLGELFIPVSHEWHIFRRVDNARHFVVPGSGAGSSARSGREAQHRYPPIKSGPTDAAELARSALLDSHVPPSVVIAIDDRILYAHGDLDEYLRFPSGEPRLELMSVLRQDLAPRVRAALYKCRRAQVAVTAHLGAVAEGPPETRITVSPAPGVGEGVVVISFEPVMRAEGQAPGIHAPAEESIIAQLEGELRAKQDDLESALEELEVSTEKLRTANQESSSLNEELQSANEELESTNEELRSLNEELARVNVQLRENMAQLERSHNDQSNFFASTKLVTLFLDAELRIQRFTPAAEEVFRFGYVDQGRHIGELGREHLQLGLIEDARSVLDTLVPVSRELGTGSGRWYIRQVLPYRTESPRIEGVVVSWTDVSELKQATQQLAVRARQQAAIARLGLRALHAADIDAFMEQLVREVRMALDTDYCMILELEHDAEWFLLRAGSGWRDGVVGSARVRADMSTQAGYTLLSDEAMVVEDVAKDKRFSPSPLFVDHDVASGLSCNIEVGDSSYGVVSAHSRSRRRFSPDDGNFLQAVANVLAGAVNRKKTRQWLAVDQGVTQVLANARSMDQAMPRICAVFAQELDIAVCELWTPDPVLDRLRCTGFITPEEPHRRDELHRFFADRTFARGEGLPGRVWQRTRAERLTGLGDDDQFARAERADELGMQCALALPITAGSELISVMCMFSRRRLILDETFLQGLDGLGAAIGDFMRRSEAEWSTRTSEERFRLAVDAAGALVYEISYPDNQITFMLGADRLLGETVQMPMPGSWWFERVHPDDRSRYLALIDQVATEGGTTWTMDYRIRHRDGHYVFVDTHGRMIRDQGQPSHYIGVVLDASERTRTAAILSHRERRLRLAIGALDAGVFEDTGQIGTTMYLDNRWIELLGYRRDEIPTSLRLHEWLKRDVVHPLDRESFDRAYHEFISGQVGRYEIEVRMRHKHGHWMWCRLVADATERDESGRVKGLTGLLWDVTQAKEAERRLQRTFDTSHMGIAFAHANGRITRCNNAALSILGYSRQEFEDQSFDLRALSPPAFRDQDRAMLEELLRTGRLEPAEKDVVRKDGKRITILFSAATLGFDDEFVAFLVDLTRQKKTEAELAKLAHIVESSDDAILSKDLDGIIQSWNCGAEHLYGYTAEEVVGKPIDILIPAELADEFRAIMERLRSGEHIETYETVRLRKDGTRVDVSTTVSPVMDKNGRIIGVSTMARDITERKRHEAALREADQQKDQFLAMLGHELRNPLAAIRNASEFLKLLRVTNPKLQRTQGVLDRQTAHMAKLIDGLLDVSRMVQKKIVLDEKVVDLIEILGDVLQDHAGEIERKRLTLHTRIIPGPVWVKGDRVRLAQILDNLLSNAIKFTQRSGAVHVVAECDRERIMVRVRDTGVGIDADLLPHIFEPFRQATQSLDRSTGGLGLGLSLVKGLVQLHGGEVEAHSEGLDRGAEFRVCLPITEPPHAQPIESVEAVASLRLLIVEDNQDTANLLCEILAASNHKVEVAYSAPRALEVARAFKPQIILCDIGLPDGMSGYDLARTIRDDEELRDVYLVALTGYGGPDDRRAARDAGFDGHLTKPVSLKKIQSILAQAAKANRWIDGQ